MKRLMILAAALLAACTPGQVSTAVGIPTPIEYAERTAVDEQVGVGIENGYKAFRTAMELAVDTGFLKGERAATVQRANRCAYAAVNVYRQAYLTANKADLLAAARSANIAIEQATASFTGDSKCSL